MIPVAVSAATVIAAGRLLLVKVMSPLAVPRTVDVAVRFALLTGTERGVSLRSDGEAGGGGGGGGGGGSSGVRFIFTVSV